MRIADKPRKRAVRLRPDAAETLRRALTARWRNDGSSGRLTRETRADLLGVSVATANKILSGHGVDRSTLAHAFKSLELPWDDAFCEPLSDVPELPATDAPVAVVQVPRPRRASRISRGWAAMVAVVLLGGLFGRNAAPSPRLTPSLSIDWTVEYDQLLRDADARYHAADYPTARILTDRILRTASAHDSSRNLPGVLKLSGDVFAAQGRHREALADYEAAHRMIQALARTPWPDLEEALGLMQARFKDFKAAKKSLLLCLEGYRASGDPVGIALGRRNLGTLAFQAGDVDVADAWFGESLAGLANLNKPDIVADIRGQQGLVMLKRGRVAEAIVRLKESLAYWQRQGHQTWIATCEMRLGIAEAQLGELVSAKARLARSRDGYKRVGDTVRAREAADQIRFIDAGTDGS